VMVKVIVSGDVRIQISWDMIPSWFLNGY